MKTKTTVDAALTRLARSIDRPWDNGSLPSYEDTHSPMTKFINRWTKPTPTAFTGTLPTPPTPPTRQPPSPGPTSPRPTSPSPASSPPPPPSLPNSAPSPTPTRSTPFSSPSLSTIPPYPSPSSTSSSSLLESSSESHLYPTDDPDIPVPHRRSSPNATPAADRATPHEPTVDSGLLASFRRLSRSSNSASTDEPPTNATSPQAPIPITRATCLTSGRQRARDATTHDHDTPDSIAHNSNSDDADNRDVNAQNLTTRDRRPRDFDPITLPDDYIFIPDPHSSDPSTQHPTHTLDGDPHPDHYDPDTPTRRLFPRIPRAAAILAVLAGALLAGFLALPSTPASHATPPIPIPLAADQPARTVTVDVQGKVRRPGLRHLPDGARIYDAIKASGGPLPGTDTSTLNLARKLDDGEQIHVGAPPAPHPAKQPLVDLNTAPVYQLDALPGVGIVTAQRIVEYRERQRFTNVEQLRQIDGIGPARYARLKDLVTVH